MNTSTQHFCECAGETAQYERPTFFSTAQFRLDPLLSHRSPCITARAAPRGHPHLPILTAPNENVHFLDLFFVSPEITPEAPTSTAAPQPSQNFSSFFFEKNPPPIPHQKSQRRREEPDKSTSGDGKERTPLGDGKRDKNTSGDRKETERLWRREGKNTTGYKKRRLFPRPGPGGSFMKALSTASHALELSV